MLPHSREPAIALRTGSALDKLQAAAEWIVTTKRSSPQSSFSCVRYIEIIVWSHAGSDQPGKQIPRFYWAPNVSLAILVWRAFSEYASSRFEPFG